MPPDDTAAPAPVPARVRAAADALAARLTAAGRGAAPRPPAAAAARRSVPGAAPRTRTAGPRARTRPAPRPPRGTGARGLYERARRAWDRPLTAYYVILGASMLITVLGLVMVYSASIIKALELSLPATYFFRKQFVAAVLGAGLLLLASRMPVRLHRALAYPLLVAAVVLMVLVQVPGVGHAVNGNQNWLHIGGPFQLQPSEFGKLALILWGADLLARKQDRRLLTQWKHLLVPLVPVAFLLLGLIMLGGDMGTAIILTAVLFGLLWLTGAPTRLFAGVLGVAAVLGVALVRGSDNRMARIACLGATDPGPGTPAGRPSTASTPWRPAGGSVPAWGRVWKNGVNSRNRTPTSSSPSPGRNWGWRGRCRCSPCSRL